MTDDGEYVAGVCNIGDSEIRRRRRLGIVALAATVILLVALVIAGTDPIWRLLIFIPAFFTALGFIQARMHFCAYFGLSALVNFGEVGSTPEEVWEAELRGADRRRAWTIIGLSAIVAGIAAAVAVVLPL